MSDVDTHMSDLQAPTQQNEKYLFSFSLPKHGLPPLMKPLANAWAIFPAPMNPILFIFVPFARPNKNYLILTKQLNEPQALNAFNQLSPVCATYIEFSERRCATRDHIN